MDADRLAAYLAGELDADETAAVEAALARDPGVRADLDAMRRADEALRSLPATELPAGFERRLRAAVDAELAVQLRGEQPSRAVSPAAAARAARDADQLAARRERRSRSWVPALAGAAAAVAVIAGTVVGIGALSGGDDDSASDMAMETFADEEAADDGGAAPEAALPAPGDGPTIVASDRALDDDLADELLASAELGAVTDRGLDPDAGRSLAASWRGALEAFGPASAADATDGDEAEMPAEEDAPDAGITATEQREAAAVRLLADAPLEDDDLAAASRCLDEVLAAADDAIPAYLELATYDGEPVVVVGLVTFDPATDAYTRPEVWVLAREDCQPLRFSQG